MSHSRTRVARPDVLVGHTGFVGSNLAAQTEFDLLFNSTNSAGLRGGSFGHVFFSAARAEKWRANADPAADAAHVAELISLLGSFRADRVTLISTVDVFASPNNVDEDSPTPTDALHPYGANRLKIERALRELHPESVVVRLPALFGPGLKKNVVFDLLNGNQMRSIRPGSTYQYYDLERLSQDIGLSWANDIALINLVTEPLATRDLVREAFHLAPLAESDGADVHYDVHTKHWDLFGGSRRYVESACSVLERLHRFSRPRSEG